MKFSDALKTTSFDHISLPGSWNIYLYFLKIVSVGGGIGQGVDNYTEGFNNNFDLENDGAVFAFVFAIPVQNTVSAGQS